MKIMSFDGDQKKWFTWKSKFLISEEIKGYKGILEGKLTVMKTPSDDDEKLIVKVGHISRLYIIQSCEDILCANMILLTKS